MFSSKKKTPRKGRNARELGRKTPRNHILNQSISNNTSNTPKNNTPLKRARIMNNTPKSSSSANDLPSSLRSYAANMPTMLRERIIARQGLASGNISTTGKWCYVVCDDALYLYPHTDTEGGTSLLVNGEQLTNGRQNSTTTSNHLKRICVLENTTLTNGAISRTPNVLYVTETGDLIVFKNMGSAEQAVFQETLKLDINEECTSIIAVSEQVALVTTHTGKVVVVHIDLIGQTILTTDQLLEGVSNVSSSGSSTSSTSSATATSGWSLANVSNMLWSSSTSETKSDTPTTPYATSQHVGTLAVSHLRDDLYRLLIVRPGGPSRLGVLLLAQHTVNGTTGAIVDRSTQPCEIQIANCKDPVDPIHVVHAKDIQSDVVVVAHGQPSTYTIVQISSSWSSNTSSNNGNGTPVVSIPMDSVSGVAWDVQLLPCGPTTSTTGTFPAEVMLYAACSTLEGSGNRCCLLRSRLKRFSEYNSGNGGIPAVEHIVSSDHLRGSVLGGGVVRRRPHFLSTVQNAAIFTASQSSLLNAFTQSASTTARTQTRNDFATMNATNSGLPTNQRLISHAPQNQQNQQQQQQQQQQQRRNSALLDIRATTSISSATATGMEENNATLKCVERMGQAVTELVQKYHASNLQSLPQITKNEMDQIFQSSPLDLLRSALVYLIQDVLDRGPHLSHSVASDDRITHKMVGQLLNEKHIWMECCHHMVSTYARDCEQDSATGVSFEELQLVPIVRTYSRKINAARDLYQHEQDEINKREQQQGGNSSSSSSSNNNNSNNSNTGSIVERARELVVSEGNHGMTKAQLKRLGLGVADAYYGRVTSMTEILPKLKIFLRGLKSTLLYDTLKTHLEVLRAVSVLLRALTARNPNNIYDKEPMLDVISQQAVYDVLLSSVLLITSDQGNGDETSNDLGMVLDGPNAIADLRDKCTESVHLLISETDVWRRDQSNVDNTSQHLYEACFANVVPRLLEVGMDTEVRDMGVRYAHYDTLYDVCTYISDGNSAEGAGLMQTFMQEPELKRSDRSNKEYPKSFSHYCYDRL